MLLSITPTTVDALEATLSGRLDTLASSQFEADMQPLLAQADKHITLDCSSLDYICSSGLRLFLLLRKQVEARGGSVVIRGLKDELLQVFRITGFDKLFDLTE